MADENEMITTPPSVTESLDADQAAKAAADAERAAKGQEAAQDLAAKARAAGLDWKAPEGPAPTVQNSQAGLQSAKVQLGGPAPDLTHEAMTDFDDKAGSEALAEPAPDLTHETMRDFDDKAGEAADAVLGGSSTPPEAPVDVPLSGVAPGSLPTTMPVGDGSGPAAAEFASGVGEQAVADAQAQSGPGVPPASPLG